MELKFRGSTYNYQPATLETPKSEINGHFLGQTYSIRRPLVTKISTYAHRKYRGVAY